MVNEGAVRLLRLPAAGALEPCAFWEPPLNAQNTYVSFTENLASSWSLTNRRGFPAGWNRYHPVAAASGGSKEAAPAVLTEDAHDLVSGEHFALVLAAVYRSGSSTILLVHVPMVLRRSDPGASSAIPHVKRMRLVNGVRY